MPKAEVGAAGAVLQEWLEATGRSQEWLVEQINTRRAAASVHERVQRSNLWRWMTARQRINVDEATLIQQITEGRVPVTLWSIHHVPSEHHGRDPKRSPRGKQGADRAPVSSRRPSIRPRKASGSTTKGRVAA